MKIANFRKSIKNKDKGELLKMRDSFIDKMIKNTGICESNRKYYFNRICEIDKLT